MADHLRSELCCDALNMALGRRGPVLGLIHHSDRGVQGGFNRSSQHPFDGGVGDALSTWLEARSNVESRSNNYVAGGFPATLAGVAIARHCQDVLERDALKALQAVEAGALTPAVENIIEVNTLLSGLGFENVGCSAAHGVHDGLTILRETHSFFHGEKVAFGTICLMVLENRDLAEIEKVVRFCRAVGLPTTLADLNIIENVSEKVRCVAEAACLDGGIIHATPVEITPESVTSCILAADRLARSLEP
ncbi:MAG: iron-containing alcohol dehydrogenase [Rhodobacteraceae bacterium]|nr:iron-containing alcohol dehydrogenase [Paracoccaceae bacterium]